MFQYNIYGGVPTPLVNGKLGYTAGNVIGPSTLSMLLHATLYRASHATHRAFEPSEER